MEKNELHRCDWKAAIDEKQNWLQTASGLSSIRITLDLVSLSRLDRNCYNFLIKS